MSKFYTEIAKYYDYIFPVGNAQIDQIKELTGEPPKDILDVACGSGGYSKLLSDQGYNVTAIDLDASMVQSLQKKDNSIDVQVLNMLDIEKLNKTFDLIFCIGNSLVHLNNNDEIHKYLKACKQCLKPEGKILIQIINYDRVLAKNVKSLSTIKNEQVGLVFERNYEYLKDKHKINFNTILKVDGKELENNVLLHPIKSTEILDILKDIGYKNIHFYGNFKKEEYNPMESVPLVITSEI